MASEILFQVKWKGLTCIQDVSSIIQFALARLSGSIVGFVSKAFAIENPESDTCPFDPLALDSKFASVAFTLKAYLCYTSQR